MDLESSMFHVLFNSKACEHVILVITTSEKGNMIIQITHEGSIRRTLVPVSVQTDEFRM